MSSWIYKDGEIPSYKNESIERRYLNNVRKNQILKVKSSLLELKIDFIELKDRELKDSKINKIKSETEELFFKLIIVSMDDMDKFEQKEIKRKNEMKL